ncbi:Y-family DNA polymerase [Terracoccus luteus]|uniref:DNA polymerase-4 n=2 Tax=Terracoccus luteus TaxID=53356 RepID=A0A839PR19_9MICO|nr:DNA polymerase IV [Terracoccus luteus]MBB2986630.1 DNA polymerase-4 [Terracoccus luteus]MCP2171781.1 DNA polymerase-4 [Terracoccus luteus]
MTVILHADADAFFASVEQRDDPTLRGRPMVVAHEVVACASYEARALGVHAGMPVGQLRHRWPEVVVTGYRTEAYEEASAALFALFGRFSPLVEPGSMEEAFVDVTGRDRGDPAGCAAALRAAARDDIGLPVSVGVGRTKLMAKLASRRAKPDGIVVVDPAREAWLRPRLPLDDLWGVGPRTVEKLTAAGLLVVRDLETLAEGDLQAFGVTTALARRLVSIAAGTDDATVRPRGPRGSVGATRSMPSTRSRSAVEALLDEQVQRALERLADDPRVPRRLEVVVRFDDGVHAAERGLLPRPTRVVDEVQAHARVLLARSGWEHDGRGVTMTGVSIPLPKA